MKVSPAFGRRWQGYIFLALALASLAVAVAARFRLSQQPVFDSDFWGYLHPALSALTGHGFQHTNGRDSLYPAFLFAILRLTGDFRAISVVQHLLGLATGALMLVAWRRGLRLLNGPESRAGWIASLSGLAAAAAFVTAPSVVHYEQSLRPEAIFPFVAVLSICLNLEFIHRRWIAPAPRDAAWLGAAQIVASVVAYKLKPSFGFSVLLVNLPMLVSLVKPGMPARAKLAMAFGGGAFCGLFLILPETLLKRSDPTAALFLPDTLMTIHADQIRDQLAEDIAAKRPSPFPPDTVKRLLDRLDVTLPLSRRPENGPFRSLGFNPDYLLYRNCVYDGVTSPSPAGYRLRADLGYYYYFRTAWRRPARMMGKIWRELRLFYRFGSAGGRRSAALRLQKEYRRDVELAGVPTMDGYAPARTFVDDLRRLSQRQAIITQPRVFTRIQFALEALYLPGMLATLLLAARRRPTMGALVALLLLGYNFGNNLTIAIVHTFDLARYIKNELAYTLLASAFCAVFVFKTIVARVRRI